MQTEEKVRELEEAKYFRQEEEADIIKELERFQREESGELEDSRYEYAVTYGNLLERLEQAPYLWKVIEAQYGAVLEADREYCHMQSDLGEQLKRRRRELEEEW